ncbi:AtpZ/AtpI family protein [Alkalibacter mobilis]|uniref:AtpZ/AtpI family protein n=1 Tax=Alkalibacter mobilis TaxID=2787712 RepID=UPI001A9B6494|nr:AtpZ/AtpI family protein [Alkalibacter mobilis]
MDEKKPTPEEDLAKKISSEVNKKIKSKNEGKEILFGMGVFGIIGWSVAIPTLIGVALGNFLDKRFQVGFSWTLTFLFLGLIIGCFNAWHWIKEKSDKEQSGNMSIDK